MKSRFLSFGAAWLACFGMVLPSVALAGTPGSQVTSNSVHDVELTADGRLAGQLLDSQGIPGRSTQVTLSSEGHSMTALTDEQGRFLFDNVQGGTYQVSAQGTAQTVRVWHHATAPPAATSQIMHVAHQPLVRGQYGPMPADGCYGGGCDPCGGGGGMFHWLANPWVIGAAVAAAIAIPVALSDDDDDAASP